MHHDLSGLVLTAGLKKEETELHSLLLNLFINKQIFFSNGQAK